MATGLVSRKPKETAQPAPAGPVPITQDAPRRRRRPVVVGAGLALAAVGALVAVWQVDAAGNRVSVMALAHDVKAGEVVKASDLIAAQVAPDPALAPVPVTHSKDIVGKVAAADLHKGSLVTDASVSATAGAAKGKDTVGILAKPGQLPARSLRAGDAVIVVNTPAENADPKAAGQKTTPDSIPAVVVLVSSPDANGAVVVDVAVSGTDSSSLAVWAARGTASLVLKAKN
ncbi:SAF domain-containing protein [Streptomyces sp. NPDC059650]|uniref:SAF domain-containing protein n=1 Tax=Streptomyces sp. NPDC059650 TaxID=3346896 RepID=UPI0036744BE3